MAISLEIAPKVQPWPVSRNDAISTHTGSLGVDLEWDSSGKVTILGTAVLPDKCCSTYLTILSEDQINGIFINPTELVGHNIVKADMPMIRQMVSWPITAKTFDTMIYFYLTNAHLCKARDEKLEDREEGKRGGGYMNLWTMASLYTNLPNWKECRGEMCVYVGGGPCPKHNVLWYNALDALAPLIARDKLEMDAKLKRVDHLYPILEEVSFITYLMEQQGIAVDIKALEELEMAHETNTDTLREDIPPEMFGKEGGLSFKKVHDYFKNKYGVAPDTTSEEDIRRFHEKYGFEEAGSLVEFKECGKGLKSWFDRRYIRADELHPTFHPAGATSTGRWASARPNFQNIPKRRAKDVRRIIKARPGYTLYRADYKQAEARCVLYQAGYQVPDDLKAWLMAEIRLNATDPGVLALGGVWNAIKSFMHAGHYGEGLLLLEPHQLKSPYYINLIAKGALDVYEDWKIQGKSVAFTGVNLASRMFGKASLENRAKALDLQRCYFGRFDAVRKWQRSVSGGVEKDGQVRAMSGHLLQVYGWPEDMLKTSLATLGSNQVAFVSSLAVIRAYQDGTLPLAQIHDEILYEFPDDMPESKAVDKIRSYQEFEHESSPGLMLPVEISKGKNWGEMEKVYG